MILSLKDKYDKLQGRDLPMLSRSGKSTVCQYLSFSKYNPNDDYNPRTFND